MDIPIENIEFQHQPQNEKHQNQKILRVPDDFGERDSGGINVFRNRDSGEEVETMQLFRDAGFIIVKGGEFNLSNPYEIGIHARRISDKEKQRDEELSRASQIPGTEKYSAMEIFNSDLPIVVKRPSENGGLEKYLLETFEQKVRFVAWASLGQDVIKLAHAKEDELSTAEEILAKARNGDFSDNLLNQKWLRNWSFEKYYTTPSSHNTSYRVLVDGMGQIHYGLLLFSEKERELSYLKDWRHHKEYGPLDEVTIPGSVTTMLLTHTESPFYLHSKDIASNTSRGGSRIQLNGVSVNSQTDQAILISHNIDPNRPKIPEELVSASILIGKASRGDFPYVGVDYLLTPKGYVFLEANKNPQLNSLGLGISSIISAKEKQMHLYKKIIEQMNGR